MLVGLGYFLFVFCNFKLKKKCKKNGFGLFVYCVIWCIVFDIINYWKLLFKDKFKIKLVCFLCVKMCV